MILKSIKLENIRSYLSKQIDFPTGSVLLSGDIGSGKSTILLAIEFVLFGVKRNDLSGAALLRHGKKTGSVELKFDLDGKEIIIKRVLKRGKDDVKQEAGYTIMDGVKKEGTHIELKSQILDLLGYPDDLVTRSKDLIYRYTVYTQQGAMKQILMEDRDVRLDTLRKVFNIDKYKRIRENSQIFIRELKENRKNYEGRIADLEEKKKLREARKEETRNIDAELKELLPKAESIKKEIKERKELIEKKEKQVTEFNNLSREMGLEELRLRNNLERREYNKTEIERLVKETDSIKRELEKKEIKNLDEFLKLTRDKEAQINFFQKAILDVNRKLSEFETRVNHANETKDKITKLDKCPLCQQDVTDEHKKSINEREERSISSLMEHIKEHKGQEEENKKKLESLKKELDELRKTQMEVMTAISRRDSLSEKEGRKAVLEKEQEKIKQEIGRINAMKADLSEKMEKLKDIEKEYRRIRSDFDSMLERERAAEISQRELEARKGEINKLVMLLDDEIDKKLRIKESLGRILGYQHWFEEHFIRLMGTIEKHVMFQVYTEFNGLFQQWFNMLIDDETLSVRLDDEFTPVVEQNGYETSIDYLSGGERTSVALAYRLALNKVINDIISQIKTKDILILDEPTEGFSTEQLDKVRDVLEQLNIKQIIIVSHESKIEGFVDNVIRISKSEHVSDAA